MAVGLTVHLTGYAMTQIARTIHLHDRLGEMFGEKHTFFVDNVSEMGSALRQFPGFEKYLRENNFNVVRGPDVENGFNYSEHDLRMDFGNAKDIHLLHADDGAKKKGITKIIVGIIIIVGVIVTAGAAAPAFGAAAASSAAGGAAAASGTAAVAVGGGLSATAFSVGSLSVTFADILLFGVSTALTGFSQLLAPTPSTGDVNTRESPDERASFLFNGAVNTAAQGQPIPLVYGRMTTGSIIVSSGIQVEQI